MRKGFNNYRRKLKRIPSRRLRLHRKTQRYIRKAIIQMMSNIQHSLNPKAQIGRKSADPIAVNQKSNHSVVETKKISVLIVSSLQGESFWRTEQFISDQFHRLVKEVVSIKAYPGFTNLLSQYNPDLLLFIGNDVPPEDLNIINTIPLKTAIWLSDEPGASDSLKPVVSAFDYVFTQNTSHIPFYWYGSGCKQVVHLPFAADPTIYFPKSVPDEYQSDVLIIGDAGAADQEYFQGIQLLLNNKKVRISGKGWENEAMVTPIPPDAELSNFYNGADIIINWSSSSRPAFDASACGAFQLIKDHPHIYGFMRPGENLIAFHTPDELQEKLNHYMVHVDQKRQVATNSLWGSKYEYSCLQLVSKLLHVVMHN